LIVRIKEIDKYPLADNETKLLTSGEFRIANVTWQDTHATAAKTPFRDCTHRRVLLKTCQMGVGKVLSYLGERIAIATANVRNR